jgi:hypothetical protein
MVIQGSENREGSQGAVRAEQMKFKAMMERKTNSIYQAANWTTPLGMSHQSFFVSLHILPASGCTKHHFCLSYTKIFIFPRAWVEISVYDCFGNRNFL